MNKKLLLCILVMGIISLLISNTLDACPACKNLDEPIAKGYNISVLFMMAMPFTVFGIIGGSVFYFYRRANRNLSS